jgi:hypothetical protein
MDVQGVSLFTARSMGVHVVSISTASSMDVAERQGVHPAAEGLQRPHGAIVAA